MILAEEVRRRDAGEYLGSGSALNLEHRGRSNSKGPNDRFRFNERSQSRERVQFKGTRECFYCGKKGHIRRNCWHWNKEQTKDKNEENDNEKESCSSCDY